MANITQIKNSILNISDINILRDKSSSSSNPKNTNTFEIEGQLINFMKLGDNNEVSQIIDDLFDYFSMDKQLSVEYIQSICIESIYMSSRALFELGEKIDTIVPNRSLILDTIYNTENLFL